MADECTSQACPCLEIQDKNPPCGLEVYNFHCMKRVLYQRIKLKEFLEEWKKKRNREFPSKDYYDIYAYRKQIVIHNWNPPFCKEAIAAVFKRDKPISMDEYICECSRPKV